MPARCGSHGPMLCLNGATCNETTGTCVGCPAGFMTDNTVFRGNDNCGLSKAGIYFVYVFSVVCALLVCGVAARILHQKKKKSPMRRVLMIVVVWTMLIPFYILTHWLEGFQYGVASTILFIIILILVNIQVFLVTFVLENFLQLTTKSANSSTMASQNLYRTLAIWNAFWLCCKLVFGLVMLVGVSIPNDDVFNIGNVALVCSLVIEVSMNIFRGYYTNRKLVRAVHVLHMNLTGGGSGTGGAGSSSAAGGNTMNPVILDFARRVESGHWLNICYGIAAFLMGASVPVLFVVFDSSVPYSVVMWAFMLATWPVLGIFPVLLLRTRIGAQMDKQNSKPATDTADMHHRGVGDGGVAGGGRGEVSREKSKNNKNQQAVVYNDDERDRKATLKGTSGT